ncbi:hypothetical protein SRABI106_02246 [Rahnella aquatilis]|nr:hypothetical protein SRABI106_02246 [Rahnella aquatilis]
MMPDQAIQFFTTQGDGCRFRQINVGGRFNDRTGFTTTNAQQQRSSPFDSFELQLRIHTTFIAMRSIRVQTLTACTASN